MVLISEFLTAKAAKTPIICPQCNQKSGMFRYTDTVVQNFPLYCKHCKKETIISFGAKFRVEKDGTINRIK